MKTSNKLLIAFAAALILIPALGIIIVYATKYKKGSYISEVHKIDNFSNPTETMKSIAVATPFEYVNIADAKGMPLNIEFIKDEKWGIKIHEDLKDLIAATVDANGQLQIEVKDKSSSEENNRRYFTTIYIYSPNIKSLHIINANSVNLSATTDTLTVLVQKSGNISFNSNTQIKQLNIKAVDAGDLSLRNAIAKSIAVDLYNTNFFSQEVSFDNVSIASSGKCKIELKGGYSNSEQNFSIHNLTLHTKDIADIKLENIKVANCSGTLSDETMVQMPAVNLNQMYKK